ncbi:MAG: DUF423 domain-containing protein [Ectothiorhodospiraceae bacterium]|jgi:uncharacterized membrane protein YgdD (TMEM256/DUF423 family)
MSGKWLLVLGSLNAFVGVAFGAFGAHALRGRLSTEMSRVWETAVQYQLVHALGLLVLGVLVAQHGANRPLTWAGWLMLLGVVIFSGSLYVLALSGVRWLGAITPIGGTLMLVSWLLVAWGAWRLL